MISSRFYHLALSTIWCLVAGYFLIRGLPYYQLPLTERPYADTYEIFTPAGTIGLSLGVTGTLMILVGVVGYGIRKRVRRLSRKGLLRHWLSFHIFLCSLGPFLIMLHTSFKVGGLVSISFWCMVLVVLSGIIGRYVYARIPRSLEGKFKTLDQLKEEQSTIVRTLAQQSKSDPEPLLDLLSQVQTEPNPGFWKAFGLALQFDVKQHIRRRKISRMLRELQVDRSLQRQLMSLLLKHVQTEHQMVLLLPFARLFRYWHAFHLPLTIVMFVIVLVHVLVAVALGYVWEF